MSQWFCSTVYVQNIKDEMKTKKNILISVYKDFEQFFDIPGGTNQDSNVDDEETAAESQQALIKTVRNKLQNAYCHTRKGKPKNDQQSQD